MMNRSSTLIIGILALFLGGAQAEEEKPRCEDLDTSGYGTWECIDKKGNHTTITRSWSVEMMAKSKQPIRKTRNAIMMQQGVWRCTNPSARGKTVYINAKMSRAKLDCICSQVDARRC